MSPTWYVLGAVCGQGAQGEAETSALAEPSDKKVVVWYALGVLLGKDPVDQVRAGLDPLLVLVALLKINGLDIEPSPVWGYQQCKGYQG